MLKLVLPIVLALVGTGAGVAAGLALRSPPEVHIEMETTEATDAVEEGHMADDHSAKGHDDAAHREYVKLNNQFVVPVVEDEKVTALVVMSLSVEVGPGQKESVYEREPKLRDSFLQVLFDHANMGGFRGAFTSANNMDVLRRSLNEVAKKLMGGVISDVLIIDIARQDI